MKYIVYFVLFFLLIIGYYLMLSSTVLLFGYSYITAIHSLNWFVAYMMLLGWWMPFVSLLPYKNEYKLFDE